MQLPPAEELVLVSGSPPIRAHKTRYYEDRQLRERILPPPKLAPGPKDAAAAASPQPSRRAGNDWTDAVAPPQDQPTQAQPSQADGDAANAGLRREPELPAHEEIAPAPSKASREFEPRGEKPHETQRRRAIQRRFIETARQASLDLGDDMGM